MTIEKKFYQVKFKKILVFRGKGERDFTVGFLRRFGFPLGCGA